MYNKMKEDLLKINLDCTSSSVAKLWDAFTLKDMFIIEKMYQPIISVSHNKKTVIIECWEVEEEKNSHVIAIPDCHISDDMVAHYFDGLALFLNLIRPDAILLDNFHFGWCFDFDEDAEEEIYYDEEEYIENLEYKMVSFIATEILMNALIQEDF